MTSIAIWSYYDFRKPSYWSVNSLLQQIFAYNMTIIMFRFEHGHESFLLNKIVLLL